MLTERIYQQILLEKKSLIVRACQSCIKFKKGSIHFMTKHNFDTNLRGLELNGIIVDCAFMLSQGEIDQLYRAGIPCMLKQDRLFFIFVG